MSRMRPIALLAAFVGGVAVAEEADKVASSIAMQQISYRDIRARRVAIKELITRIKAG